MSLPLVHVITTLERAGAEMLLLRLLQQLDPERFPSQVVCLGPPGAVSAALRDAGVKVRHLDGARPVDAPRVVAQLRRRIRDVRPAIVHTWMIHANLLGGLAARLAGARGLVWSVHHSDLPDDVTPAGTRAAERLNVRLSRRLPEAVVCTSSSTRDLRIRDGYPADKLVVIRNGVPAVQWTADDRRRARAALGVAKDDLLIGRVARLDPQKDYRTLLRAAAIVCAAEPRARLVLAGRDVDPANSELAGCLAAAGVSDRALLLGDLPTPNEVHGAVDVEVSSSAYGETAPLVVSEALACGTPVVGTDVGDTAALVGPGGRVVPPRDPEALAAAILSLLRASPAERQALGERGREWSREELSLDAMTDAYQTLYEEVAHRGAGTAAGG
jgi:glycosyltransferase involved in cell wall biosynthesis